MAEKIEPIALPQPKAAACAKLSTGQAQTSPDIPGHSSSNVDSTSGIAVGVRSIATMFTYFIQRRDGGPIKIGKTGDIARRLSSLLGGTPETLVCIAYIQGDVENELHEKFHGIRVCGEWFAAETILLESIAAYAVRSDISRPPLTPEQIGAVRAYGWAMRAKWTGRLKKKAITWEA